MKALFDEYLRIIMYTLIGLMLVMSSYVIILNVHHNNSLSEVIVVSDLDNDYLSYKNNINLIEERINKRDDSIYKNALTKTLNNMKKGGVFRLVPKTKLSYYNLYELNDFFMEELINNSWVSNIKELNTNTKYEDDILMLVNNSKYINSIFTSNSTSLYDSNLDNRIEDNYHFILNNYLMYSKVILNICNELGGESG